MSSSKYSLLVSSCDMYSDLWDPFFFCLDKFWNDINFPIYLNTEKLVYSPTSDLSFNVITLNQNDPSQKLSWSQRFIDSLKRIDSEYIVLLLDDYFVCNNVDSITIDELICFLDNNPQAASIQLNWSLFKGNNSKQADCAMPKLISNDGWKAFFTPTIWRKKILLKWLRSWENVWAFEQCGSKRAERWYKKDLVYVLNDYPVIDYLWVHDCSAVVNGKWLNEKPVFDFFDSINCKIDYSTRGFITYDEYHSITMKDIIKRYSFLEVLVKLFNRLRSFF